MIGKRLTEILSLVPAADRPYFAAIAAMTYDQVLLADPGNGRAGP